MSKVKLDWRLFEKVAQGVRTPVQVDQGEATSKNPVQVGLPGTQGRDSDDELISTPPRGPTINEVLRAFRTGKWTADRVADSRGRLLSNVAFPKHDMPTLLGDLTAQRYTRSPIFKGIPANYPQFPTSADDAARLLDVWPDFETAGREYMVRAKPVLDPVTGRDTTKSMRTRPSEAWRKLPENVRLELRGMPDPAAARHGYFGPGTSDAYRMMKYKQLLRKHKVPYNPGDWARMKKVWSGQTDRARYGAAHREAVVEWLKKRGMPVPPNLQKPRRHLF